MTESKHAQDNPNSLISVAKPHTIKKFEIMEQYVDTWARKILGVNNSKGIVFIDCMCNSGCYIDQNGNPVEGTPIRIAKRLNEIVQNYKNKSVRIYFNDVDGKRVQFLKDKLDQLNLTSIEVFYNRGDANQFLKSSRLAINNKCNKLLFYDPYLADIDWDAITPFLHVWGEVVINHMVSDTVRGVATVKDEEKIQRYEKTYHKQIEDILSVRTNRAELDKIVTNIIKERANDTVQEVFIASFPFYNNNSVLVYNLIFFSKNIEGLKLFKKVAWKAFGDKSSLKSAHNIEGQMCFSLNGSESIHFNSEENAYTVSDIAKYIYEKYKYSGNMSLNSIYLDLDRHPIFPSDGYKNEIRECLKNMYGLHVTNKTVEFK